MKPISIIIPNWNGEKQLRNNLPHLIRNLKNTKSKGEIIIIDDASTDQSVATINSIIKNSSGIKISKNDPNIFFRLLRNKVNLGFAETVNIGVKAAKYQIVFLLNTDVRLKNKCLNHIVANFKDKDVFAVGANHDDKLGIGNFIDHPGDLSGLSRPLKNNIKKPCLALWVCGGNSAFDRNKWLRLGGLDSFLYKPFYLEEIDLCYRAWKRGYITIFDPKAKAKHNHNEGVISQNFSKNYIDFVYKRNQLVFIWKNIADKDLLIRSMIKIIKKLINNPKYIKVVLAAIYKLPNIIKFRKMEAKKAKIKDYEILKLFSQTSILYYS